MRNSPGASPGLGPFLNANGVHLLVKDLPVMLRSLGAIPESRSLDGVEIVAVASALDQAGWLDVLMEGFEEPEAARDDFRQYLGYTISN